MGTEAPTVDELRRAAAAQGVDPSDEDLAAVQAFLAVLLPAFDGLHDLVEPGTPPAALFVPTERP